METVIFSTIAGVDIALDYKIPSTATPEKPAPILLWWHGGGLIQGSRTSCPPHLLEAPALHGLCLVSADYRLAPQTKFPGILADIAAAMAFVRSAAFKTLTANRADATKLIVSGGSAGGWLSLLAGTGVGFEACGLEPPARPLAIAAIYPISDLRDPFWKTKQNPVSYFERVLTKEEMSEYLNEHYPPTSFNSAESKRSLFYTYMVQEALLSELLLKDTGIDEQVFSIALGVSSGEFTAPPTYIVHGTIDDKVPIQQAIDVAEAMKQKNIEVDFDVLEGEDHLFDKNPKIKMDRMYAFIKKVVSDTASQ